MGILAVEPHNVSAPSSRFPLVVRVELSMPCGRCRCSRCQCCGITTPTHGEDVDSANGEGLEHCHPRSRWEQRSSYSDPTLGQSQAPQMSLLVSGQPMGVSLDFPTSSLVRRSRRNRTASPNHLDNDGRRPNQRMRERMLNDSLWFMCSLDVQTTNSGTMRTASVLNRYMGLNR